MSNANLKFNVKRFTPRDREEQKERALSGLGYLLVLFFVPLVARPQSRPGKHCANQGLTLLVLLVALRIVKAILGIIPLIGWLTDIVLTVAIVADVLFALYAYYMYYEKGELVELPYSLKVFH